jgi:hypothetical protein
MRVSHPLGAELGLTGEIFHVFELLKWNEASSQGLIGVALMTIIYGTRKKTLLFMVSSYECEWNNE